MSERLFEFAMKTLGRRVSRRRFLARFATAGSALAVAPIRYASRPLTPMQVLTTCSSCSAGSSCCDGWTTFCCTLTGSNACPSYSYMAGWWKCTNYTGGGACSAENVRYYVDCNRTPYSSCPHGCHCANDTCQHRRTCCNVFRYGQCNTQISGVTEVVCRMDTCDNPSEIFVNCTNTLFIENAVCGHEASCL